MGVRLGQRVAANQGMETPFALVIAHSPLRGRLGRQLAVNFSRLRDRRAKTPANPVGSGWLEHPTSAMSTLRSNQLS